MKTSSIPKENQTSLNHVNHFIPLCGELMKQIFIVTTRAQGLIEEIRVEVDHPWIVYDTVGPS